VNSVHTSKDSLQRRVVLLSMVTSIDSECSVQTDMTEMTPTMDSVHTSYYSLQRPRVQLSVVTIVESDCSEQGEKTEMTPILNTVHTFNDRLH
jgi:hypothetical protein